MDKVCDVLIVGSGAAGISLALSLADYKGSVLLVDGGENDISHQSQELYEGEVLRQDLPSGLSGSRLRFFGGSTNCWAGGLGVFDEIDFVERSWVRNSGWPIKLDVLRPFYASAAKLLQIDVNQLNEFGNGFLSNIPGFEYRNLLYTKVTRFKDHFSEKLRAQKNLSIELSMNVKKIHQKNESIDKITFVNFANESFDVKASKYVLATGGIENARLLLLTATRDDYADAIGNHSGHLGRYFCDHPIAPVATLTPKENNELKLDVLDVPFGSGYQYFRPYQKLPDHIQREFSTLNAALNFQTQELPLTDAETSGWKIYKYLANRSEVRPSLDDFINTISNPIRLAESALQRKGIINGEKRLAVRVQIEQAPMRSNRVVLSQSVDSLNLRRATLDFDFSPQDRHTIDILVSYLAKNLLDNQIGMLRYDEEMVERFADAKMPPDLRGGQHHSGTTRMSSTPDGGVVDENLSVWNYPNLYLLGSSCFPTNGWVNPTFTIVAMAHRLSHFLKKTKENV